MVDSGAECSVIITPVLPSQVEQQLSSGPQGTGLPTHASKSPSDSWIPVLTGVPYSPTGQWFTDKAWSADYLCPQEACEPHPVEPINSDDGCDHAQGRWNLPLFFRQRTDKSNQPAKRVSCCLSRKGAPSFSQKSHTHHGGHEAKGHSCQRSNIQCHRRHAWEFETTPNACRHQNFDCQSPLNTMLLPVKKPGGNYCLHNLYLSTIINTMITSHPVVPNPYTLLSLLPIYASWFTCLNLKDSFFCLRCHGPASPSLPLSGKTHTPGDRHSWLGPDCCKSSRTHLPCLVKSWLWVLLPSPEKPWTAPSSRT